MRTSRLRAHGLPLLVLLAALVLLLIGLGSPERIYFDEVYYVNDARDFVAHGVEDGFVVHPPMGKLVISVGIHLFGDTPFGWRFMGAVTGALTVMLAFLIGRRLFRRDGPALVAALLLASDGLFFSQARISMLDIHLAFFVALGAWLLLVDHDRVTAAHAAPAGEQRVQVWNRRVPARVTLPRPSRWARHLAGIAFGLAIATKWSGLFALGGAGLLTIGWELAHRQRVTGFMLTQWARGAGSVAVGLVLLPAAAYAITWTPWFLNFEDSYEGGKSCPASEELCEVDFDEKFVALGRYHQRIWRFHDNLEVEHGYRARAYTWPVMTRPVVYYWESCSAARASGIPRTEDDGTVVEPEPCVVAQGDAGEILAVGNPALWYPFLAAAALLMAGLVRRDWRAIFTTTFWLAQFVPWLIQSRPLFFFYMAPNVLFLALGVAWAVTVLDERIRIRATALGTALGAATGWGLGLLGESLLSIGTPAWPWVGMGIGWLYGAAIGAIFDHRAERDGNVPLVRRRGTWVGAVVTALALLLFAFFSPVWTGDPLDRDQVELRWWQPGWI